MSLLNEMMKTAVVVNQERTRAIQSNPDLMKTLDKVKAADNKRINSYYLIRKSLAAGDSPISREFLAHVDNYSAAGDERENASKDYRKARANKAQKATPKAKDFEIVEGTRNAQGRNETPKTPIYGSDDPKHLDSNAAAQKMINESKEKFRKIDEELASKKSAIETEYQKKLKDIRDNSENAQKEKLPKSRNRRNKMIGIGAAGIGAAAGGAYLYNRYKKKKQEEAEKTAGLLDDLMKTKNPLGLAAKKRSVNPLREAARKAQFEALSNMRVSSLGKKAFLDFAEMEKIALMNKIPTTYPQKPIGANPSLPPPKSLLGKANQAPYEPLKPIQATKSAINNSEYMDRFRELSGGRSPGQAVNGTYTKLKTKLTTPTPSVPTPSVPTPKIEHAAGALGKSGKSFKFKAGAGLGIAALGTGAYLYGRNRGKKKQEEMGKYSTLESEDFEKTAVTKEEKEQLRRMTGMAKRKVKKKKPNKTKESMYRMKKQKKHAAYDDAELEKMASLMADQFIAASALTSVDSENMNLEEEIIAGYKSYIDEVNS